MSLVVTAFCEFVSILLFRIIDIICVILDGLVVIVRGLVCRLAKEVSGVWFHLVFVWGGSDIVGMFGIGWLNVGFGVSPSHMEHFPLWFQLVDRFDLFRWFARSSASSGTVEVGKGDIGRLWIFSSNDPFGRLVCIALVGFAADHLAGFVVVRGGCCVGGVVRWLGFGNGRIWRAERSFLLKRIVRGRHVVWRCVVDCRVFVGVLRWAWYGVGIVVHCVVKLGMVNAQSLV